VRVGRLLADLRKASLRANLEERRAVLVPALVTVAVVVICAIVFSVLSGEGRDKALSALVQGILVGGVYALIALGVVVVFKSSRVFNLAHGGILMFFTFLLWWLLDSKGLPLPLVLILLVVAGLVVGLGVDRFLMRRTIGRGELIPFIITLFLGFSVMQSVVQMAWGGTWPIMPEIFPSGAIAVGGAQFTYTRVLCFAIATVMFLAFVAYFRYTRSGLAMRCVSEDHVVSQSIGINVKRIFAVAWAVGGLSAAVGGLLLGVIYPVNESIGGIAMMRALPVILLGGIESVPGAFFGAIIIGLTESIGRFYIDPYVGGFSEVLPLVLMLVILIVLPNGLFGQKGLRRI
jgi:branched-chain amino acid transport system permease protein